MIILADAKALKVNNYIKNQLPHIQVLDKFMLMFKLFK